MKTRLFTAFVIFVTGMVGLFSSGPASVPPAEAANRYYYYDFERAVGMRAWAGGTEYEGPSWPVLGIADGYNACPPEGNFAATLTTAAWRPFPAVWMVTRYPATGPLRVTLDWRMKGIDRCEQGCYVMAYMGRTPPTSGKQFVVVGQMKDLWQRFHYEAGLGAAEYVYVAIGFGAGSESTPLPGIELGPRAGVDCISVSIRELGGE